MPDKKSRSSFIGDPGYREGFIYAFCEIAHVWENFDRAV